MENNAEIISKGKKKAYEPPVFRRVNLEIKTSVLAACSLSIPQSVTNDPATCTLPLFECFGAS
jgi:hypothetical protein